MGELFAGSLVDYYAAQRTGEDPSLLSERLQTWFEGVATALATHGVQAELSFAGGRVWCEPLPTTSLDALRLLAAYAECSDLPWPEELASDWTSDPAWARVSAADFQKCHFPQVAIPTIWLPVDLAFTSRQPLPDGSEAVFGSLPGLREQLGVLNQRTLQYSGEELLRAGEATAPGGRDFLACAEHGLAMLLHGAAQAPAGGVLMATAGE